MLLTATPDEFEVREAVFGLNGDSSPGPDSFGGSFYQKCWDIISDDVTTAIIHLFTTLEIPDGMNSSMVTLLPKVADSIRVTDFRLIVMGNFSYKIFTKIIAMRLGSFISDVLSSSQYGFISGRSIHSCVAIASEIINSLCMGKSDSMAIKVDIAKTFDTISWDFLLHVLNCMGFSARFVQLINGVLSSAKLLILINGTPHRFFSCSRGVRQGDPLSPLLFCIAEETLILWLDHYIDIGKLTVHKKLPRHLFYADDILIFMEVSRRNGRNIKRLLKDYGKVSGQIYSPSKSSIFYSPRTSTAMVNYIKRCTAISTGSLPFKYLGVPIFLGTPKVQYLAPIADSVINIFSRWHGNTLSLAGRCCLISSVIASSLVHRMMIYRWPRTLINRLEVAIRSFLWTGNTDKKGFSNVAWKRCCAPLAEGGFGIRSLRIANSSFCCKLAWDFLTSSDTQAGIISKRYFDSRGNAINRRHASSI